MRAFDSHAHLTDSKFQDDLDDVIKAFQEAGVYRVLDVSEDLDNAEACIANARKYDCVFAAAGVHPHNADKGIDKQRLTDLCGAPKVRAVGEIGLDYHYEFSSREAQRRVFEEQLIVANELKLPVIIHSREAAQDTIEILSRFTGRVSGVLHCFSGSYETAKKCVDIGLYISFAGPLTYPKSDKLRDTASRLPFDRLLVETDCPYLSPQPVRGKRNQPAYVIHTLKTMAALRGMDIEEAADITSANARRLFGID